MMQNSHKQIWVIDDDPGILEVVQIILSEEGYMVKIISDGDTLTERFENEIPNLIFLDILMSGIDGRDISRKIKDDDKTKDVPVIIMSADMRVEEKTKEAKADGYLRKPFNIEDLLMLCRRYVQD